MKWHLRYFEIAKLVGDWSKDPSTKVGAVIVGEKGQIVSQGYNGFPRNVSDETELYNNREVKYSRTVHAEANAIFNAMHNNTSVRNCKMYITGLAICNECAKVLIQCGISEVFTDTLPNERWVDSCNSAIQLLEEANVKHTFIGTQT